MRGVRAALCALACAAAFPFAGCGGGGGGGGGFVGVAGPPIAGKVVAGSVGGATVRVYRVNADRTLTLVAEGTTAADGTYTLTPSGSGPFLLVASGGTYKDEATGQTRSLPVSDPKTLDDPRPNALEAIVGGGSSGPVSVSLTPLSTFASRRVAEASRSDPLALDESAVTTANRDVAREFGLGDVDPRSVAPLDLTDPAAAAAVKADPNSPAARMGAVLAGLSQQASNLGLSDPLSLVEALARDFADGALNGQTTGGQAVPLGSGTLAPDAGTAGLSAATTTFLNDTTKNVSGTTATSFSSLITAVSTQDVAPANVNKAPSFDVIAAQSVVADGIARTVSITNVTAGAGEDGAQTLTFTATSSDTTLVATPTIAGSGTTRFLSFVPAAAGTVTITVKAQDSGGVANGGVDTFVRAFAITIGPNPVTAPSITSVAPTTAITSFTYSYTIVASGNPAPVLSVTGTPAWLARSGNVLSGTPSIADVGTSSTITIAASNGIGSPAVQSFAIQVLAAAAPAIGSTPASSVVAGSAFSYTVTATGTPTPTLSASGLPAWLTFSNGVLSGTPSAANVGNTGLITITATNGVNPAATQSFTIAVQQAPAITSTAGTAAVESFAYSYTITTTGFPAPSLSVSGNPAWLSLVGNVLAGTPLAGDVGTNGPITITASNGVGTNATQTFSIMVAAKSAPSITSTAPTTALVGTPLSYTVTATGSPAPSISVVGQPAWLSLSGNVLSGTPGPADAGPVASFTVVATNGVSPNGSQTITLTVNRPPAITSSAATAATVSQPYSYTIATTGYPTPTLSVSGNPSWLTLTGNVLSGTPSLADQGTTGTITLTAANGVGTNATQTFQITVGLSAPTGTWDGSSWDGATWGN